MRGDLGADSDKNLGSERPEVSENEVTHEGPSRAAERPGRWGGESGEHKPELLLQEACPCL